jgi:hypothetical protein
MAAAVVVAISFWVAGTVSSAAYVDIGIAKASSNEVIFNDVLIIFMVIDY